MMTFIDSKVEYLPEDFISEFPNLYRLNFTSCSLRNVLNQDFFEENYERVVDFMIYNSTSRINLFEAQFFESLPELRFFRLIGNKIDAMESQLFRNSSKLLAVSITDNEINEIPYDLLGGLPFVRVINFNGNGLKYLNSSFFEDSKYLIDLDLSNNQIEEIDPNTFTDFEGLKSIVLFQNLCVDDEFLHSEDPDKNQILEIQNKSLEIGTCYGNEKARLGIPDEEFHDNSL